MTIKEKLLVGEELRAEEVKEIFSHPMDYEVVDYSIVNANMAYVTHAMVTRIVAPDTKPHYYKLLVAEYYYDEYSYFKQKAEECEPTNATIYISIKRDDNNG